MLKSIFQKRINVGNACACHKKQIKRIYISLFLTGFQQGIQLRSVRENIIVQRDEDFICEKLSFVPSIICCPEVNSSTNSPDFLLNNNFLILWKVNSTRGTLNTYTTDVYKSTRF